MVVLFTSVSCATTHPPPPVIESIQRLPLQTIDVDGDEIAYLETGTGPPLILLHGFGGAIWNWEHQQLTLSSQYRVITLDLLGSGMSAKPHIPYSPSRLVTFFLHFMDALGIDKATLIGNSMGAGLAMATALTVPDRVTALVLISGFPQSLEDTIHSPLYKNFLTYRPPLWMAKLGSWFSGRATTRRVLQEILYDHSLLTSVIIERSYQNRSTQAILPSLYSLMEHMDEWEQQYGKRIHYIRHPTLLLWGEEDRVFPAKVGHNLQKLLPQAQWHLIPKGGHFLQWEKPKQINLLIQEFLANLPPDP
ncbi:MAG: alpha/beta fold hydrolase [Nitrospirales bacterium]